VTDFDLPLLEMGFSSCAELLQRVPGLEVVRPPNVDSVMVYSTWSGSEQKVEEPSKEVSVGVVWGGAKQGGKCGCGLGRSQARR
jgi:hypothetical protein